ncbi:MAG TPA: very short patch repair endonuclease [Bradyrhizobium sp.]|nr:very short patch repair endonuclease [Bradyrhizobium sp.]
MPISQAGRSRIMRAIRSKNTKPEMVVRRLVSKMGYRYRLHRPDLPGRPDLAFGPQQRAIFVHGCFWHVHSAANCSNGKKRPKTNTHYWTPKLRRNIERDRSNILSLKEQGWKVLVVWECEVTKEDRLANRIRRFLG